MSSCFEILGIVEDATEAEVRLAWLDLARKTHPDVGGTAEAFRAGHAAYLEALKASQTPKKCSKCDGAGVIKIPRGWQEASIGCPECGGTGLKQSL